MSRLLPAACVAAIFLLGLAQIVPDRTEAQARPPQASATQPKEEELTAEEKRERDVLRACKVAVCAALHNRKPGKDIACNLVKTWRKEQVEKVLSLASASWPWGGVKCSGAVALRRDTLIKAMSESKFEVVLDRHSVACQVEREKGNAEIKFDLAPKVTFENGKAVKATLNWGKIEGPSLVKGVAWTAAATDNAFNVLQGKVISDVNEFISTKCDEVKDEWRGK